MTNKAKENNTLNLKAISIAGFLHAFKGQAVRLILTVTYTVVLARLLTPGEYGLFFMAWVIVGFVHNIRDLGLTSATVQSPQLEKEERNSLFWVNVFIGVGFTLLIMLCAPLFAKLYGRSELSGIFTLLAVIFIFGGFNIQFQAVFRRNMEFLIINRIHNFSLLVGIIVAICLALNGAGYWSLVGLHLSNEIMQTLLFWRFSNWKPGRIESISNVKSFLTYGKDLSIFNIGQNFTLMFDQLILGWLWGASVLGIYNRMAIMLLMPLRQLMIPLGHVSLSTMSKLQNEPLKLRQFYWHILNFIGYLWIPFCAVAVIFSHETILIVLGPQWTEGGIILKILAIGVLPLPFYNSINWVYQALGKTRQLRNWGYISVPSIIYLLCIGAPFGGRGIAIAYAAGMNLLLVCRLFLVYKQTPICLSDIWDALVRPLIAGALFLGVILLIKHLASGLPSTLTFLVGLLCGLISFFLLVTIWPSLRREVFYFPKLISNLRN